MAPRSYLYVVDVSTTLSTKSKVSYSRVVRTARWTEIRTSEAVRISIIYTHKDIPTKIEYEARRMKHLPVFQIFQVPYAILNL
jgi:hypothetical protein